jgi:hypothetical protein
MGIPEGKRNASNAIFCSTQYSKRSVDYCLHRTIRIKSENHYKLRFKLTGR